MIIKASCEGCGRDGLYLCTICYAHFCQKSGCPSTEQHHPCQERALVTTDEPSHE